MAIKGTKWAWSAISGRGLKFSRATLYLIQWNPLIKISAYTPDMQYKISSLLRMKLTKTRHKDYLTDAVGKSLFKDELQDRSYFLVDGLVVSLTGAKVSQLIPSSHFKHSMTCEERLPYSNRMMIKPDIISM